MVVLFSYKYLDTPPVLLSLPLFFNLSQFSHSCSGSKNYIVATFSSLCCEESISTTFLVLFETFLFLYPSLTLFLRPENLSITQWPLLLLPPLSFILIRRLELCSLGFSSPLRCGGSLVHKRKPFLFCFLRFHPLSPIPQFLNYMIHFIVYFSKIL